MCAALYSTYDDDTQAATIHGAICNKAQQQLSYDGPHVAGSIQKEM
jgi:hypothetical protein